MSAFYGQVTGSAETSGTRRGTYDNGIEASVQSWNGSVVTGLNYDRDGILCVNVYIDNGSSSKGALKFSGTFEQFERMLEREGVK